jgi:hypothetical protein
MMAIFPALSGPQAAEPVLAVQVLYGPEGGPERFRADFENELLQDLRARGCFSAVVEADAGTELLFRVLLEAPVEEQHNTLSLAGSIRNEDEMGTSSTTSIIRVHADLAIRLPASGELFRSKRIRGQASYQPTFAWEDGTAEVRDDLIRDFARQLAGFACKANGRKLRKKLAGQDRSAAPIR